MGGKLTPRCPSTPFCMLPITRFEYKPIGDGQVGQITKKILDIWSVEVGVDIVQQAEYCASYDTTDFMACPRTLP